MTSSSNRMRVGLLALVTATLALASCENALVPVHTGPTTYGVLSTQTMGQYFYPRRAGLLIIYQNALHSWLQGPNNSPTVTYGSSDTLRTLGYLGIAPNGDSLFGYTLTYRVKGDYSERQAISLRYLPTSTLRDGAFIDTSIALTGEVSPSSPAAHAVNLDTVIGAVGGRAKTTMDLFGSTGTTAWLTDTIRFTSSGDSVLIWRRTSSGTLALARQVFVRDFQVNDSWTNDVDGMTTAYTVLSEDQQLGVADTTVAAVRIEATTSSLQMPVGEERYFAFGLGIVKQVGTWWTTNGATIIKHQLRREASVIVKDWDEII